MTTPVRINVNFDKIREIAHKGVRRTAVFLGLGFNAAKDPAFRNYELVDISPIHLIPSNIPDETVDHFKTEFGRWIVACGLRELIETFAFFLEHTHNACLFMAINKNKINAEDAKKQEHSFHREGIKGKLNTFESQFDIKPDHPEYIISIQKIRNCLTHRLGIVDKQDCDDGEELILKWMGFDIFIETPLGETIDLIFPLEKEIHLKDGGTVKIRYSERVRAFKIGALVDLEARDLVEICNFIMVSTDQVLKAVLKYVKKLGIPDSATINVEKKLN